MRAQGGRTALRSHAQGYLQTRRQLVEPALQEYQGLQRQAHEHVVRGRGGEERHLSLQATGARTHGATCAVWRHSRSFAISSYTHAHSKARQGQEWQEWNTRNTSNAT